MFVDQGRLPRLTTRVFTDLAVWMVGFGLLIGLVFPVAITTMGVPGRFTLRPAFFAATIGAGLFVSAVSFGLARGVVGARLRRLTQRMRYVSGVIHEATYSGDWDRCSPAECEVVVDSDDELGDAASAFNQLLWALAGSRAVETGLARFSRSLAEHLDVGDLAAAALRGFIERADAEAGVLCLVRDGELQVEATHRLDAGRVCEAATVLAAVRQGDVALVTVPEDLLVDAAVVTFRPAAVAVLPIRFKAVPVAAVVLAFREQPSPETLRLVDGLRDPASVALNNALAHERFQHLAAVDPLTGVYNRRFGLGRLAEEWNRAVRTGGQLGLIAFDLDHFKNVNDTYGHLVGDRVLREVTAVARLALRIGDVFVRTGGEEFLIVLPGAGLADVRAIAERIRRSAAAMVTPVEGGRVQVTLSLGALAFPDCYAESPEQLVSLADEALYAAKHAGRNRVTVVSAEPMDAAADAVGS